MNQMLHEYSNQRIRRPQLTDREEGEVENDLEDQDNADDDNEDVSEEEELEKEDEKYEENVERQKGGEDEGIDETLIRNKEQQYLQDEYEQEAQAENVLERPDEKFEQQKAQVVDGDQMDNNKSDAVVTTVLVLHNSTQCMEWNDAATQYWRRDDKYGDENLITLFLQSSQDQTAQRPMLTPKHYRLESNGENVCQPQAFPSTFLPIDNFPDDDPFLPWIHDYWFQPSLETTTNYKGRIQFVAQNRRRCQTGEGKESIMKHWEPQISLFQTIPVLLNHSNARNNTIRISDSVELATVPETRFICHFHSRDSSCGPGGSFVTFSEFNFNYEYVLWRKRKAYKSMFLESGRDVEQFELSSLLFSCPVPRDVATAETKQNSWKLDLVPIRTPPRRNREMLMTLNHVGPQYYEHLADNQKGTLVLFREKKEQVSLAEMLVSAGRWANLPLCWNSPSVKAAPIDRVGAPPLSSAAPKPHYFVACTWTAANYFRRGDATAIRDSEKRLREWITFHKLVGLDHVYVYDNTNPPESLQNSSEGFQSPLKQVVEKYFSDEFVTYIPWPCKVCSNNRPNHPNPGERSSQYAAESSCRERFGAQTEWMSFIDIDEFLVPMMPSGDGEKRVTSWKPILEQKKRDGLHVLKMRSSRGKPRVEMMETIHNDTDNVCKAIGSSKFPEELCLRPLPSQTLLRVYNCEYIRPPKPERFQRAMKQIYRPAFVLSHYVHYSTITKPMTEYYGRKLASSQQSNAKFHPRVEDWEWGDTFLDELEEGCLSHTKSIVPHETMYRSSICKLESNQACPLGYQCPDSTEFVDKLHQKNVFTDQEGNYCNCWINHHLEDTLIPLMEEELQLSEKSR